MASNTPQFEVRCAHCNVSFAIGTRKCIHCGRATTAAGAQPLHSSEYFESERDAYDDFRGVEAEMGEGTPFDRGMESDSEPGPQFGDLEAEDVPSSLGRTLMRSMGSLIWIALIIGFSIFRNGCGE